MTGEPMTRKRIGGREPYARIYASAKDHPKHLAAGLEAEGLWKRAMAYCADHLTDGTVPATWLEAQGGKRPVKAGLKAGLFEACDAGYRICDYLDHNPSRSDVEERRDKERGKKSGLPPGLPPGVPREGVSDLPGEDGRDSSRLSYSVTQLEGKPSNPPNPRGGGVVVRFDRQTVPGVRVALAEQALADFNDQARSNFGAYTANRRPSQSLQRIIGALTAWPDRLPDLDACRRLTAAVLESRWWGEGAPTVGVVFGPKVIEGNFARLESSGRRRPIGEASDEEVARSQARNAARAARDAALSETAP